MDANATHMQKPVRDFATKNFVRLRPEMTVEEALGQIRQQREEGRAPIYFYVVDAGEKLAGVLQTRSLLIAQPEERLADLMIARVVAIPETATVLEACEFFVLHKFLAFPVVDRERRVVGVVDISLFNEEVFGIPTTGRADELFQAIGFHITQVRQASPLLAFRFRFPWLLATIAGGTVCAFVARAHEQTLARTVSVAFFLTLVLSLGESVAVQSLALALETLHARTNTLGSYFGACRRELLTALPIALAAALVVFPVVWMIGREVYPAAVISGSLALVVCSACLLGITIPALMHAAKLDLTVAPGPITLAVADVATLLIYLALTSAFL